MDETERAARLTDLIGRFDALITSTHAIQEELKIPDSSLLVASAGEVPNVLRTRLLYLLHRMDQLEAELTELEGDSGHG